MSLSLDLLDELKAKSCRLNQTFQRLQSELKELSSQMLQPNLSNKHKMRYKQKFNKLMNEYSFDINRLETECMDRCQSLLHNQPNDDSSNQKLSRTMHNTPIPSVMSSSRTVPESQQRNQCTECGASFKAKKDLAFHIRNTHNGYPYMCPEIGCNHKFKYQDELRQHNKATHCHTAKVIKRESTFIEHGEKSESRNHICDYFQCGKRYSNIEGLHRHIREDHGGKPLICSICWLRFEYKRELTLHSRSAHGSESNEPKRKRQKIESPNGRMIATEDRISSVDKENISSYYQCSFCPLSFTSGQSMGGHVAHAHKGQRNLEHEHQCKECHRSFVELKNLAFHIRNDHEGYPYACRNIGCNHRFKYRAELKEHTEKAHSHCHNVRLVNQHRSILKEQRPSAVETKQKKIASSFQCSFCLLSFTSGSALGGHIGKAHRGRQNVHRAHQCQDCHRSFVKFKILAKHIRNAHQGFPYQCSQAGCEQAFKCQSELQRHRDSDHRIVVIQNGEQNDRERAGSSVPDVSSMHLFNDRL